MFTQGEGLHHLSPRSLLTVKKWKTKVELAPNCPRCDSSNTKFCYYNNYSLTQPRYFCKNCRRYWTKGGSLRNVPMGGGSRKYRRSSVRISSNSTNGVTLMPSNDASTVNSVNSMATSRADAASTIDLALLYAKFLNHDQLEESNTSLGMPELPNDFNPSIHLPLPSDQSTETHFDEMHQVFVGEFDMNHKQEERIPQFMNLGSNGYGFQPLPTEDGVIQDMFWSNPPPLMNSNNFPWHMQRFEPVVEDQPIIHSNPLNGNKYWSSFDLPQL
ncbi:hypothetical protein NE237_003288 [Protea cynaroides]|uniref:Dof zinc finger protein n=1 Tax=Protea cynaroides TaxID=273540 RepID=A0A9Q0KGR5_9MAGN|nr:hypothetical protein NE237_003288 [Protea cynaroides]